MISPELVGIIISVVAILIAIIGMGIMVIQKIDIGDARTEAKVDAARTELKAEITKVDVKIDGVRTEVDTKIDGVRTDLDVKIDGVRTEFKSDISDARTELKADIDGVRTELKADIAESGARAEAQGALVIAEIRGLRESVDHRLNGIEREQARQEGILSVLVQRDRARADSDGEVSED